MNHEFQMNHEFSKSHARPRMGFGGGQRAAMSRARFWRGRARDHVPRHILAWDSSGHVPRHIWRGTARHHVPTRRHVSYGTSRENEKVGRLFPSITKFNPPNFPKTPNTRFLAAGPCGIDSPCREAHRVLSSARFVERVPKNVEKYP